MATRSFERRARHTIQVMAWLATYVAQGHPLTFQTRHPEPVTRSSDDFGQEVKQLFENEGFAFDPHSSVEIVFRIADWDAFVGIMEPKRTLEPLQGDLRQRT